MSQSHTERAGRVMQRLDALAAISETPGVITRTFGTPAFVAGRELVQGWMQAAGLATRVDNIGNLRGRLASPRPGAKTFVIGSHLDTVVNAGRFDGPLGVLLGLEALAQLRAQGAELPFHLELMAFSDEEGVRFHTTYLGSQVAAGLFDDALLHKTDSEGVTLAAAVAAMGGDPAALAADALPAADWLGYLEVHIEQGPVLWQRPLPVAVVQGIAGQRRSELIFSGVAGHAGTVPMTMRRDALAAAAEFVLAVEQFGQQHHDELVATVGKLHISHAASNVIPGEVLCTLDLRSADAACLAAADEQLRELAAAIAHRRHIELTWRPVQQSLPVHCDPVLTQRLGVAIGASGYDILHLISGAGHDAVPISQVAPVAMLFVRCFEGISHNPLENVELPDLAAALRVTDTFLSQLVVSGFEVSAEHLSS